MTDIRRSAVSDHDENKIVKYQVEERKDDKLRRHAVIGIGGSPAPTPITITPLTVKENGIHDAGENAAYNPVTVDVPPSLPNERLMSHYDFTNSANWNIDLIRDFKGQETGGITYANITQSNNGLLFGSNAVNSSYFKTWFGLNWAEPKRIEIEFGDIDLDESITTGYKYLMCIDYRFAQKERGLGVNYSNSTLINYTASGRLDTNIPVSNLANHKLIIYFGCFYDSITKKVYKKSPLDVTAYRTMSALIEETGDSLGINYQSANYDAIDGVGIGVNNSVVNEFTIKSVKIYELNNLDVKPINN